jgi:hypothetical protein
MKTTPILLKLILFGIIILSVNQAFSQSKFETSGGFGWPDMLNLKIRYGNNFQIGISQSFWVSGDYLGQTSAEIYYHFGGKSKFTEQHPWYLFSGLGCLWGHDDDENDIYFYPRVGRSFNLSKRTGINLDGGAFFPLSKGLRDFLDSPIYPSGSISFFIRL